MTQRRLPIFMKPAKVTQQAGPPTNFDEEYNSYVCISGSPSTMDRVYRNIPSQNSSVLYKPPEEERFQPLWFQSVLSRCDRTSPETDILHMNPFFSVDVNLALTKMEIWYLANGTDHVTFWDLFSKVYPVVIKMEYYSLESEEAYIFNAPNTFFTDRMMYPLEEAIENNLISHIDSTKDAF